VFLQVLDVTQDHPYHAQQSQAQNVPGEETSTHEQTLHHQTCVGTETDGDQGGNLEVPDRKHL